MGTTTPANLHDIERARQRLADLRALKNPGQCLRDANGVDWAMRVRRVTLADLGLAGYPELMALRAAGALADGQAAIESLRSLPPDNTGGSTLSVLYGLITCEGVALGALDITPEELTEWIRADLMARARAEAIDRRQPPAQGT